MDSSFFEPGKNCWRVEHADRAAMLIDMECYLENLKSVCRRARHSIFILGWDFDRRERIGRGEDDPTFEQFFYELLDDNPELEVNLLLWDFHPVYAAEREWFQDWKLQYKSNDRMHVHYDNKHPRGGSQHQKLVVVDDQVAFCGGIDLSRWRWDTREHRADDERRMDPDGNAYPPFHDAMMLLEGEAAHALGELARQRWKRSGSNHEPGKATRKPADLWPERLEAVVQNHQLAIARTYPEFESQGEVREVERLYLDSIAAAKNYIYIENQYFTSNTLATALVERLREDDPPEVILVLPHHTGGWLEQVTMDRLRTSRLQRMVKADHAKRLRVFYPTQPELKPDECISVHCKLLIIDDCLLNIGSANTSDRSMGLDSECNVSLIADQGGAVAGVLHNFIGEHLDVEPGEFKDARAESSRLIDAIENLQRDDERSLKALPLENGDDIVRISEDGDIVDPSEPINPTYLVGRAMTENTQKSGKRNLMFLLAAVVLLLILAAAWRYTPLSEWVNPERLAETFSWFDDPAARAIAVTALLVVASLLMVPLSLLVILNAILLGPWVGFACAMLGALISALLAFVVGQKMSGEAIEKISGSKIHKLSKKLSQRGIMAVAMLRLIPVAPFTIVNLVAGASHLRPGQFMIGSLIGLIPGIGALTVFSGTLYQAVTDPSAKTLGILAIVAVVVIGGMFIMRRTLNARRSDL